eukprot:symbB.v1.2.027471.t1/scaffold2822.1/size98038/6
MQLSNDGYDSSKVTIRRWIQAYCISSPPKLCLRLQMWPVAKKSVTARHESGQSQHEHVSTGHKRCSYEICLTISMALLTEEECQADVVVLGTGLTESICAAAFARNGQRVLHLDSTESYGGEWRSLPLKEYILWAGTAADARSGDGVKALKPVTACQHGDM